MAKFIEITGIDGHIVYINIEQIVTIGNTNQEGVTSINLTNQMSVFTTETKQKLLELINNKG